MMRFEHKKSLGQNFLNSDYVPKKMCDAAQVSENDSVLEIGPGTGALTRELLARGASVIALEADPRAVEVLTDSFATEIKTGQLLLKHTDAREYDPVALGLINQKFKVVANIPYYLSGLLLRSCLDTNTQPNTLVFLMQKELVERIAREPKESLLSLSVKAFGIPTYICTIKRGHFTPAPKVDSAILLVSDISHRNFSQLSNEHFFTLLHAGFGQKRKQLQHNLRQIYEKDAVFDALRTVGLPESVRAEDVSLQNWLTLAQILETQ